MSLCCDCATGTTPAKGDTLSLAVDDTWTDPFYAAGTIKELDRRMFAGTLT